MAPAARRLICVLERGIKSGAGRRARMPSENTPPTTRREATGPVISLREVRLRLHHTAARVRWSLIMRLAGALLLA